MPTYLPMKVSTGRARKRTQSSYEVLSTGEPLEANGFQELNWLEPVISENAMAI